MDVVNFLYDAGGKRTSKLGMNGESLYFNSWYSATEDGTDYRYLKHFFVGSGRLVTRVRQERDYNWDSEDLTTYFYHPDHLGSVSVVSNHQGVPYERVEYLPFGEVWIEDVDPATGYIPFRFTSKELDRETGLYYYGARYYEPKVSRWMSADPAGWELINPMDEDGEPVPNGWPLGFGPGPSVGMRPGYSVIEATNWYAYVSNNPVNYVDPTGEEIVLSEKATENQKKEYEKAVEYIQKSDTGAALIDKLENSEEVITVEFNDDYEDLYDYEEDTVYWDPTAGAVTGKGEIMTPALALAHEFGHAEQDLDGKLDNLQNKVDVMNIEHDNLINTEYPIATELGEPQRNGYLDTQGFVRTMGSTSNNIDWETTLNEWFGIK